MSNSDDLPNEIIIDLPWGGTLRCGPGEEHRWGGYVRVCDEKGEELDGCYWDNQEWKEEPELVMGAIFSACIKIVPYD
jgi:hypothetical protein